MKWLVILLALTLLFIGFKMWQRHKEMEETEKARDTYERIMRQANANAIKICDDARLQYPAIGCTCPNGMGHKSKERKMVIYDAGKP